MKALTFMLILITSSFAFADSASLNEKENGYSCSVQSAIEKGVMFYTRGGIVAPDAATAASIFKSNIEMEAYVRSINGFGPTLLTELVDNMKIDPQKYNFVCSSYQYIK